jgi:glycosyltransferase involved in cell wall biosynthesis
VIDATILIPTHRHAALLPYAVRSALAQEGAEIEVFVVGDGVEDATRTALKPFLDDSRVRFFDFPKGERLGEQHRHTALQEARGRIVTYLSDDDILLPDHVVEMQRLLEDANFAHAAPVVVTPEGQVNLLQIDVSRPEFVARMYRGRSRIGLTGAAHTREAYDRLPHGWRPAPPDVYGDLHMWLQFTDQPWFRGQTGRHLTMLHFPDSERRHLSTPERVAELEDWWKRSREPGFQEKLDDLLVEQIRRLAVNLKIQAMDLKDRVAELERLQTRRRLRAKRALAALPPARALLARRKRNADRA